MNLGTVLLLGLLVLVYLNFQTRRRAQRDRLSVQQRLVPGAHVVTSSGLHGTVTALDEDGTVLLETAPGHVTRWEKPAVGRIVTSPADAVTEEPATDEIDDEIDDEMDDEPGVEPAVGPAVEPAVEPRVEPMVEPARPASPPAGQALPDTAPPDRG